MLQTIRERLSGWIAVVIVAILALALVATFTGTDSTQGGRAFAAKVNGDDVPLEDYRRVYQNQLLDQQQRLQGELPLPFRLRLQRDVLESLVRNKVLSQFVEERGYRIADEQLMEAIRQQPEFQVGGEFSQQSYIGAVAARGMSAQGYENQQRLLLKVLQLQDGVVGSSFFTPTEFRRYIALDAQQRTVSYVLLSPADVLDDAEVSEAEIRAEYEANPQRYREDESVTLEYILIDIEDIGSGIDIDETALREYYAAEAARFSQEEQRKTRHILVAIDADTDETAAQARINEVRERLLGGAPFEELAGEYSDDPGSAASGGDLGWVRRGVYGDAFDDALFALDAGAVSAPVRTEFGFHLIRADEIEAGSRKSFEEMREELEAELRRREAEDRYFALAERVDELALESLDGLEPVAGATGLALRRIDRFTRAGGQPLGYNQALVDAVFSIEMLEDGENSPLIEIEDGVAVVARVAEHRPAAPLPLEEVRERIEQDLRQQRAAALARARGAGLLATVRSGTALAAGAAELGAAIVGPVTVDRASDELPPDLLARVFRMPKPDAGEPAVEGVELVDGGYAVVSLAAVEDGNPAGIPQAVRDLRKERLAAQTGNGELQAAILGLREQASVVVASDLFDTEEAL